MFQHYKLQTCQIYLRVLVKKKETRNIVIPRANQIKWWKFPVSVFFKTAFELKMKGVSFDFIS